MQKEILAKNPSPELRVYAVWLPMLFGDARLAWDEGLLTDPRVLHFWDEERTVGQWFAEQVEGYDGIAWDAYYLYGPDATWEAVPSPLIGAGSTIYSQRGTLRAELLPLLGP